MKMCHSHSALQPKATQGHWQLLQTCMCIDKVVSTNMCDHCQPALQTFALLDKSVHMQHLCPLTFVSWHKSSTIKSLFACVWPHLYVWVQWCPAPDDEIIWQSMEWQNLIYCRLTGSLRVIALSSLPTTTSKESIRRGGPPHCSTVSRRPPR